MIDGLPTIAPDQLLGVAEQFGVSGGALAVFIVVLARIVGVMLTMPAFSNQNVPMPIRVALSLALAVIVFPMAQDDVLLVDGGGALGPYEYMFLLVNQLLAGMLMGLIAAFVVYGIQAGGRLVDNSRGANLGEVVDPATGTPTSPTGQLTLWLATALLVASGMHMVMLEAFVTSFEVLPATTDLSWIVGNENVVRALGETSNGLLVIAVKIAAPTMLSILMTDVLLGLINRAAPQVNVFMFSLPLKAVLGTAALMVALPIATGYMISGETSDGTRSGDAMPDTAFGELLLPKGTIDSLLDCMADEDCKPADNPEHAPNALDALSGRASIVEREQAANQAATPSTEASTGRETGEEVRIGG